MKREKVFASIAAILLAALTACNLPRPVPSIEINTAQTPIIRIESNTPTSTPTFKPAMLMVSVSTDTNCRIGPGKVYDLVGGLQVGETAEIFGRDPSGQYFYIRNPDNVNDFCWLWGAYATPSGDIEALPVFTPPPTPTPLPTDTPTLTPTATTGVIFRAPEGPLVPFIFRVTAVAISADHVNYVGVCPHEIIFTGAITTNGAGNVTYNFKSSIFGGGDRILTFDSAGTKYVTYTYQAISDRYSESTWAELRISLPNTITSNRLVFSIDCTP